MNRTTMSVAVVCVLGLTVGLGARQFFPKGQLTLSPAEVQLPDGHIEGQSLETHFDLRNESRSALTVTSVSGSCGCMAMSTGTEPLKTPFTLKSGEVLPLTLNITTVARVGQQTFSLWAVAEGSRGPLEPARASVHVNVLGTLRAQPSVVIFRRAKPGAELSAEVELADMLPDPGVRLREVTSSNPDALRIDVVARPDRSTVFGESVPARSRATLKVSYRPEAQEGRIQEMISVVPENSDFPTLQIPIHCDIAEAPYRFVPRGLTIAGEEEQAFHRTVVFEADDTVKELSVVRVPPGIEVDLGERSGLSRPIRITGTTADLAEGENAIVFSVDETQLMFPIRRLP